MQYRHWHPDEHPLFITWRLFETLPRHRKEAVLTQESGKAFAVRDRELELSVGPRFLSEPAIADCVAERIVYGETGRRLYELHA